MRSYLQKLILGIAIIVVVSLLQTGISHAVSTCYPSSSNCLTLAQGYHDVINHDATWYSLRVKSYTANPVREMDDIGYGWWTNREKCNGVTVWQWNAPSGDVFHYKSTYEATMTRQKIACGGARTGDALGNHWFYDWPYSNLTNYSEDLGVGIP